MKNFLLLVMIGAFNTSCASYFLKKKCEKINWFSFAEEAALKGQRVMNDPLIKRCQKAEAQVNFQQIDVGFKKGYKKYCSAKYGQVVGTRGHDFNYTFCQLPKRQEDKVRQAHQAGVDIYCSPESAYKTAVSGLNMSGICSEVQMKLYKVKFRKGRRIFLQREIQEKELDLSVSIDEARRGQSRANQCASELRDIQSEINRYAITGVILSAEKQEQLQSVLSSLKHDSDHKKSECDQLQGDVESSHQKASRIRQSKQKLQSELIEYSE